MVQCVFKSQTVTVSSNCTHSVEQINNVWGIAVKSVIASLGNISSYIYQTNMSWNSMHWESYYFLHTDDCTCMFSNQTRLTNAYHTFLELGLSNIII